MDLYLIAPQRPSRLPDSLSEDSFGPGDLESWRGYSTLGEAMSRGDDNGIYKAIQTLEDAAAKHADAGGDRLARIKRSLVAAFEPMYELELALAIDYNNLGVARWASHNLMLAQHAIFASNRILDKNENTDPTLLAQCSFNLAVVLRESGQIDHSQLYFRKARKLGLT